ncbi:hypothetical protein [Mucilaginibacter sp. UYCu711]|uniref:hypothetical protein n=1 Tax=Mucilaginibacter sp. UYCu711 TaxID=3156339 RepID=UPI003D1B1DBE
MIAIITNVNLYGLDVVARQIASVSYTYIVPIATVIAMCSTVFQGLFSPQDIRFDFTPIFRAVLLMTLIAGYTELAPLLHGALDSLSHSVDSSTAVDDLMVKMQQAGNQNKSFWDSFSITKYIVDGIIEIGMSGVRYIILALRDVMVAFLYAVGPLALALSIIPMFRTLASKWLQSFIYVHFWYLTLAVLDMLFKVYLQSYGSITIASSGNSEMVINTFSGNDNMTNYLFTNVVVMLCYILVPYLTSLYAGQSHAGAFMSKMAGVATAAAGMGAKALASGSTTSQSSQIQNAAAPSNPSGGSPAPKPSPTVQGFAMAFSNNSRPTQ